MNKHQLIPGREMKNQLSGNRVAPITRNAQKQTVIVPATRTRLRTLSSVCLVLFAATTLESLLAVREAKAAPLDNWHWRNPLPQGNTISSIIFTGDKFVAVGNAGVVLTSQDGLNWISTQAKGVNLATLVASAYGNGKYVSVGTFSRAYSSDTVTWTVSSPPTGTISWRGVAFGNGVFVAVNSDFPSSAGVSSNGMTWIDKSAPLMNGIAFGTNLFVGVSTSGSVYLSTNGVSWSNIVTTASLYGISYVNGMFVASGKLSNTSAVLLSPDGSSWTPHTFPATNILRSTTFGQGLYVAVGDDITLTSADGISWAPQLSGTTLPLRSVAYGNGRFVTTGDIGTLLSSTNGTNWLSGVLGIRVSLKAVASDSTRLVAVGESGTVLMSEDGTVWQQENSGVQDLLQCIVSGNGDYVVGTKSGSILTSTNGADWAFRNIGNAQAIQALAYANGLYVGVGSTGRIITSPDANIWTIADSKTTTNLYAVAATSGLILAGGDSGLILSSADGTNWNTPISITTNRISSLTQGGGLFVACDNGGYIYTSCDGLNWTN
jgi:hypothetical protein